MKLNIIGVLFAAGVGLAVASPAEAQDKGQLTALSGNNGPQSDPVWVLPAVLLVAGFAAGYVVRSFVSSWRRESARGLRHSSLTGQPPTGRVPPSDRLQQQFTADNSHLSIVPREDVGDLQSPQRPTAAPPRESS